LETCRNWAWLEKEESKDEFCFKLGADQVVTPFIEAGKARGELASMVDKNVALEPELSLCSLLLWPTLSVT
jgi:hypothetical protein